MNGNAIETHRLTKIHGSGNASTTALHDVTLTIGDGEFVAVMGPSGCGKSTLLNIIGGLEAPTSGTVKLSGEPIQDLPERRLAAIRADQIGFVFQHFNLMESLSVRQNVELPAIMAGTKRGPARRDSMELLGDLGLAEVRDRLPHELSGGQQQRVAIARALVRRPRIILADEPTGNLDSSSADEVIGLLRAANADGRTVVMVTHDHQIAALADRVIRLRDGNLVDDLVLDPSFAEPRVLARSEVAQ